MTLLYIMDMNSISAQEKNPCFMAGVPNQSIAIYRSIFKALEIDRG